MSSPQNSVATFFAGGVSGAVAKTVGSPLARVTILQQTAETRILALEAGQRAPRSAFSLSRQILAREGLKGFFRGNAVDVMRSLNYSGISYWCYEGYKSLALRHFSLSPDTVLAKMLAGGSAGVTAVMITYPLDVVRTRLCVETSGNKSSFTGTVRAMARNEGLSSLYRGSLIAACQSFPNLAINWAVFETSRNSMASSGYQGLFYSLLAGVMAGVTANTTTFPLDVVMKNVQADTTGAFARPMACAAYIWKVQGLRGFYAGYGPQLCKSVPICATSFAVYDQMKRWLQL